MTLYMCIMDILSLVPGFPLVLRQRELGTRLGYTHFFHKPIRIYKSVSILATYTYVGVYTLYSYSYPVKSFLGLKKYHYFTCKQSLASIDLKVNTLF